MPILSLPPEVIEKLKEQITQRFNEAVEGECKRIAEEFKIKSSTAPCECGSSREAHILGKWACDSAKCGCVVFRETTDAGGLKRFRSWDGTLWCKVNNQDEYDNFYRDNKLKTVKYPESYPIFVSVSYSENQEKYAKVIAVEDIDLLVSMIGIENDNKAI